MTGVSSCGTGSNQLPLLQRTGQENLGSGKHFGVPYCKSFGRKRRRERKLPKLNKVTRSILEMVFNQNPHPGEAMKRRLEKHCSLDREIIQIWFSSRRVKENRRL